MCDIVTLLWKLSIDHNMDVQYQRQPFVFQYIYNWSMATMLRDEHIYVRDNEPYR